MITFVHTNQYTTIMENTDMQTANTPSGGKFALISGVYLGVVLIIFSLVMYLLDIPRDNKIQWLSYVIMFAMTFVFIKQYRDKQLEGFITYGQSFKYGFLIILVGSILSAIYVYFFFSMIAPGEIAVIIEEAEQGMYDQGRSDQEIEIAMNWVRMMTTPLMISVWVIIFGAIAGLIISAFLGIFVKKEQKEF